MVMTVQDDKQEKELLLTQALTLLAEIAEYATISLNEGLATVRGNGRVRNGTYKGQWEMGHAQGKKDEARLILALINEVPALADTIRDHSVMHLGEASPRQVKPSMYAETEQVLLTLSKELNGKYPEEMHHLSQILMVMNREEKVGRAFNFQCASAVPSR